VEGYERGKEGRRSFEEQRMNRKCVGESREKRESWFEQDDGRGEESSGSS